MSAKKSAQGASDLTFENALGELETLVAILENGDLGLEASLDAFERGMALAKSCEAKLDAANGRVEKIMKDFSGNETVQAVADEEWQESGDQ